MAATRQTRFVDVANLELADHLAVKRLKYVRQRSMRNPTWRDAHYLSKFVERRYLRWAPDTPLETQRLNVERALTDYRKAAAGPDHALVDARWRDVQDSVDKLIAEAERLRGHRIKPRAI